MDYVGGMFGTELRADSYFGKASVCVFGEVKGGRGRRGKVHIN